MTIRQFAFVLYQQEFAFKGDLNGRKIMGLSDRNGVKIIINDSAIFFEREI